MMKWTSLTPRFREERGLRDFRKIVHELAKISPGSADIRKIRAAFNRSEDNTARAAGSLLCDLHEQGHVIRVNRGGVQFSHSVVSQEVGTDSIKMRLMAARSHQLQNRAVEEFISSVEKRRFHAGAWTSIFSVMRNGGELSESLRRLRSGAVRFQQVIDPYIQVADTGATCEYTGLDLVAIWRYFRHTWANPYQSVPGRSFMALIRDASAPHHPIIGIAGLASSAVQLAVRDEWIGWSPEQVIERLRQSADERDVKWLARTIEKSVNEVYLDDLLDPGATPLTRRHLRFPTTEIVEWLRKYGSRERVLHHDRASSAEHKVFSAKRPDDDGSFWRTRAETALFRSRRAEALAVLLRATLALQDQTGAIVSPELFRRRLHSSEPRQAVQSLLRRIKAERVGIAVADISICGAIPPYSVLTGGKLIAMLLASPEIALAYSRKYSDAESIIASSIAGRAIVRSSHLVFWEPLLCTGLSQTSTRVFRFRAKFSVGQWARISAIHHSGVRRGMQRSISAMKQLMLCPPPSPNIVVENE